MDERTKSSLRRRLKKALNAKLSSLGFEGQWPEWARKTEAQQHFISILSWKYGGGYQISAGYTGRGPHLAAYPHVKDEMWETIGENDVRFAHTVPDCRRHLNATKTVSGFPLPTDSADDRIEDWIAMVTQRIDDLNEWLSTGSESEFISLN